MLVERIIQRIVSGQDGLDVDELLVVTFTNASAAEMRHRIGQALEKAIDSAPHSTHLRKQLSLLNNWLQMVLRLLNLYVGLLLMN